MKTKELIKELKIFQEVYNSHVNAQYQILGDELINEIIKRLEELRGLKMRNKVLSLILTDVVIICANLLFFASFLQ